MDIVSYQRSYFQILEDLFEGVTGKKAQTFADIEDFDIALKQMDIWQGGQSAETAFRAGFDALSDLYSESKMSPFRASQELGGMKLVAGGGSGFSPAHFNSIRKMLLYADTILIPDPVLPWVEVERSEEKFRLINLLKSAFTVLHLKPLVDADLQYPAVAVFPSWEKSLELHDEDTQEGIGRLLVWFLSYHLGHAFSQIDETLEYARANGEEFLQSVEQHNLFIAPGGEVGQGLKQAIATYKQSIETWRSEDAAEVYLGLSDSELVWNGILERLGPQWHLLENSDELGAHPMLVIDAHWHYYKLCTDMFQGRLENSKLLSSNTVRIVRALESDQFAWLGNLPIDVLVELRQRGENEQFRDQISRFVDELHSSSSSDIDRVAGEVGRGIGSLLTEHANQVRQIQDKYARKHGKTLVAAWITLAALFVPTLSPFLSVVPPLALVGKYAYDKWDQTAELKDVSRSLLGVLASAKS